MESFATDSAHGMLHSMKIMQDSLAGLLEEIETVVDIADHGDFSKKIDLANKQGFGKNLSAMLNQLLETTEVGLNDVMRVTNALAAGDLSQKITKNYPGVFGLTKIGVNNTVDSLAKVMGEIQTIANAAANQGDFSLKINMTDKKGYTRTLADLLNQLTTLTETGLRDILRVADAMALGELTESINRDYPGLFGQTKDGINTTVENLKTLVGEIKVTTDIISVAAREIAIGNNDLSHRTEKQAASLEITASSMSELTATVQKNSRNAQQASQLAIDASEIAAKGVNVVDRVVTTMDDINKSSLKISDIISVIDDIAFQTNILSLNAAVEAARAGEKGKGFAVVAVEVRNLAQRAATAAGEIKYLIQDSVAKVQDGTKLVANAGQTMKEIVGSIEKVTVVMSEISTASIEQMSGIQQVNQAITQMDDVTQQNAALVEQAAAAAESLEEQTQQLSATVSNFKF
ncbi:MAG: ABC transporter permease [Methylovulum sp.]|nr:ABC transporter permease [Methylovulum sp.]MCF7997564.1 ABC transporter permease [Methylovulum sp.]